MEICTFASALKKSFIYTLFSFLLIITTLSSCDPYQQLLKSNDYELKLTKAKEFYNVGKYTKALPLFEELMSVYKGTKDVEELYYFYPYCHYGTGDYLLSSYYFKRFIEYYPKSFRTEEARFMSAYSLYKLSPVPSLEQDYSQNAIDAFQLFANTYPNSDKIAECNKLIDELRLKMEEKSIAAAQLYYDMKNYRAAGVAFNNLLLDFPGSEQEERIRFTALKSNFLFAENSITSKKEERYKVAIEAFQAFKNKFPNSKNLNEAKRIHKESKLGIEQVYFDDIKNALSAGNRALRENKKQYFDTCIEAYETFIEKFPKSKSIRDAEKLYNQCLDQIEKLENKGFLSKTIEKTINPKND